MNVRNCFVPTPKSNHHHIGTRGLEHADALADSGIREIVDEISDPQRRPLPFNCATADKRKRPALTPVAASQKYLQA
jgi:predicted metal-dependent TIM-barrel fold hydrolase